MSTRLFLLFPLVVLLMTCGPKRDGFTANGFGYDLHQTKGNPPPKIGEQAWADLRIYTKDTVLFASPRPMSTVIRKELPGEEPDLLRDAMAMLGPGDSATFYLPPSAELADLPAFQHVDYIQYDIVVYEVSVAGSPPSKTLGHSPTENWQIPPKTIEASIQQQPLLTKRLAQLREFQEQVNNKDNTLHYNAGIYIKTLQAGIDSLPPNDAPVFIHYIGCLPDGSVFAETFSSNQAFRFTNNKRQVIKGWEETIGQVAIGSELLVAIPPEFAYGSVGKAPYIRPETTLFYYLRRVSE